MNPDFARRCVFDRDKTVWEGHGANPDFRIVVREFSAVSLGEAAAVATYEEWQENATNVTQPNHARVTTVAFRRDEDGRLLWCLMHQTLVAPDALDP